MESNIEQEAKTATAASDTRARARETEAKVEPVPYSEEIAARICDELVTGRSIKHICQDDGMPCEQTVYGWLYKQPKFLAQYRGARIAGCEKVADDIFSIVDDGSNDWVKRESASGKIELVVDHEHISRSRLRFDARRWYLSKIVPKVFGDNASLSVSGNLDHTLKVDPPSMLEVARRSAFILKSAARELCKKTSPPPLLLSKPIIVDVTDRTNEAVASVTPEKPHETAEQMNARLEAQHEEELALSESRKIDTACKKIAQGTNHSFSVTRPRQ